MDELDLIRAARPRDDYPDARRVATRALLLAEMTEPPAPRPTDPGTRRISWRWQAALAAGLAICVAAAVAAVQGTRIPGQAHASRPVPAGNLAHVLELAARTATASTPPAGARWIVTEHRGMSTGAPVPQCAGTVKETSRPAYAKIFSVLAQCPATPPASLPELRTIAPIPANDPGELGYPLAIPGPPAPHVSAADLHHAAFDALSLIVSYGVSTPSQGALLEALGRIPGARSSTSRMTLWEVRASG